MPAPRPSAPLLSQEASGVLIALVAIGFFASMDAISKGLSQRYDPVMVTWGRYVSQAVLVVLLLAPRIRTIARTRNLRLQIVRSAMIFGATLCFFVSLAHIPLAEATALFEVAPLMVTALAALILREQIGPRRLFGVAAGFVGAMIIIRPGLGVFQPMALLPMLAAFFYAMHAIVTRYLGLSDSPWTTFLYSGAIGAICASLAVPFFWTTPTAKDALIMLASGAVGGTGQFLLIVAFSRARASTLAPVTYFGLVMAALWGFVFFDELPDLWTILGASVIVGSGLYVWRREQTRDAAGSRRFSR